MASFEEALAALRQGRRVARAGWNGKGMWLTLLEGHEWLANAEPAASLTPGIARIYGTNYPTLPFIAMKTADGFIVPWLASQTDILADDWGVVP